MWQEGPIDLTAVFKDWAVLRNWHESFIEKNDKKFFEIHNKFKHKFHDRACTYAARISSFAFFKVLVDLGYSYDQYTFYAAVSSGNLAILEWLRTPNCGKVCEWDESAYVLALQKYHLKVLHWLRSPKYGGGVCPWSYKIYELALQQKHTKSGAFVIKEFQNDRLHQILGPGIPTTTKT